MAMARALPRSALRTVFAVGLGAIRITATPTPMPAMPTVAEHVHGNKCRKKQHPHPVLRKPFHDLPQHGEKIDVKNICIPLSATLIFFRKDRVVCAVAHIRGNILAAPSQPTSLKSSLLQSAFYVRATAHELPEHAGAVVFDHQNDRTLIESEMPR